MLHDDRIDISEVIDVYRTRASKECIICRYLYFLDKGSRFPPDAFNGY